MSSTAPRKIEEIDTNFQSATSDQGCPIRWFDAFDREHLALRGFGWLEENYAARSFRRLPDRAAAPLSEGVQSLSFHPSSGFISFSTDSRTLSVRATVADSRSMLHMPLTGSNGVELYLKEGLRWLPVATGIPVENEVSYERQLFTDLPRARREFRLYLPLYCGLRELQIGVEADASITPDPVPTGEKPIFIYGTSITQGGCASTAGSDYVSLLGRLLNTETINFGFSGNGRAEPEVAELIREIDAELFVIDCIANCMALDLEVRLPRFVELLREHHPKTGIVLVTNPAYNMVTIDRERYQLGRKARDTTLRTYSNLRDAGDEHLHLIDGHGLIPPGVTGSYVDGVHPTSAGFFQMAERMAPQLAAIRIAERQWLC